MLHCSGIWYSCFHLLCLRRMLPNLVSPIDSSYPFHLSFTRNTTMFYCHIYALLSSLAFMQDATLRPSFSVVFSSLVSCTYTRCYIQDMGEAPVQIPFISCVYTRCYQIWQTARRATAFHLSYLHEMLRHEPAFPRQGHRFYLLCLPEMLPFSWHNIASFIFLSLTYIHKMLP